MYRMCISKDSKCNMVLSIINRIKKEAFKAQQAKSSLLLDKIKQDMISFWYYTALCTV